MGPLCVSKSAAFALQMACLRGAGGLLSNHIAKVRNKHCGSRILRKKFFIFFPAILFFLIRLTKICCGVAVLQFSKGYFHTLKILLYLYINIELIFYFRITYFGTATLQRCNSECRMKLAPVMPSASSLDNVNNRNTLITSKTFKKLQKNAI